MGDITHIKLRPSSGPVAKFCPSSMYSPPGNPDIIEPSSVFSLTGSALHAVFQDIIYPEKEITEAALEPYCQRFTVTMKGYYGIHWRSNQIREKWERVKKWYPNAKSEVKISCVLKNGFVLEGTPDLWDVYGSYAVVFDLKTGEAEIDYFPQIELYALILWKRNGALGLDEVHTASFSPMLEKYESRVFTAAYLAELEDHYIASMEAAGIRYAPGPHCRWCKRLTQCPVVIKTVDPMCEEIVRGREVLPGDLARMRPAIAVMKKIVERFDEIQSALVERFGTIEIGNGHELYMKSVMVNSFKPKETLEYLLGEKVPMEAIVERIHFKKEDIKELAREIAVMRSKEKGLGATQARLLNDLAALGAIEDKVRRQVAQRPIPDHQIAKEE